MTIWRVRVRVMWVTIWYLTMNYLPGRDGEMTQNGGIYGSTLISNINGKVLIESI